MSNAVLNCISAEISAPLEHIYKYPCHSIAFPGWKILYGEDNRELFYNYCTIRKIHDVYNEILANITIKNLKSHIMKLKGTTIRRKRYRWTNIF